MGFGSRTAVSYTARGVVRTREVKDYVESERAAGRRAVGRARAG